MKEYKNNVAILTNFMDFNPGYSLSGIVVDQALMLLKNGHKVYLFVNEQYNDKYDVPARLTFLSNVYENKFFILRKTKFMHLVDYRTKEDLLEDHKKAAKEAGFVFANLIKKYDIRSIYTHDFIFTGWNLPYSLAIKEASKIINENEYICYFFHWIHSVPSTNFDWWNLNKYGHNHFIVYPNRTEIQRIVEQFRTNISKVKIIPHIKDPRTWYDFGENSCDFIDQYPQIMSRDIIKIYPCSTDRLSAKQLHIVIKIFSFFKQLDVSNFLVIANQWATGKQSKENIELYKKLGNDYGLIYNDDFVFTSDFKDKYNKNSFENGIPRKMLRELQLLSSLFIFPTLEESFGLVGPEAALSGALCVTNRTLNMMYEVMGHTTPSFDFGSHHQDKIMQNVNDDRYLKSVAYAILSRLFFNESVMTKIYCRKRYNMDILYNTCYLPMTL